MLGSRTLAAALAIAALSTAVLSSQNTPSTRVGGAAQILTADDVLAVLNAAASAIDNSTMAAAVVDRNGSILGVYARQDAGDQTPDIAVTAARAGAMFANDQAPLSSRTIRFISGIHFPPGVQDSPNAPLYGIENTNRGCRIDAAGDAVFNAPFPRPTSIAGTFAADEGSEPLPCGPSNTRGCARGGPMLDDAGLLVASVGITTGKPDVFDSGQSDPASVPVNPGGIPIYRGGKVIGGVGVAGVSPAVAEYAATIASAGAGRGMDFSEPLGAPGAVFLDGLRLPFFGSCPNISCIRAALKRPPAGVVAGRFADGHLVVAPRDAQQVPEGYVLGPRASALDGGLSVEEVTRLVNQSVAVSLNTRAQIRLPSNQPVRMVIGIADAAGELLAVYRMADATTFSADAAMTKARNAYYFSTREGNDVLRSFVENRHYDNYQWEPATAPGGQPWAVTARTLNFAGQPLFPPGIDLPEENDGGPPHAGPWFDLFLYDMKHACTEGPGASRGGTPSYVNQSGIVWFAGSTPLYRNGQLVGGMGVSGDGVDQDDYVAQIGSDGFHPPDALRVDHSVIRTGAGAQVRLPYAKFPRNPEIVPARRR